MVEGLSTILGDSLTKLPESLEELEARANYSQHTSVRSFFWVVVINYGPWISNYMRGVLLDQDVAYLNGDKIIIWFDDYMLFVFYFDLALTS